MYKARRIMDSIAAEELDHYLAKGWFRMKQHMFTTEFLQMGADFYDSIWLRHDLQTFRFPKWFGKMKRNRRFRAEVTPFHPGPEHEMLYQGYRESKGDGFPESLESILYGEGDTNIFNTRQVSIYEAEELIGAGFFDVGGNSAMGIVSYYEPRYKSLGMGKYATMLAYEHCAMNGLTWFYPGYFVPGNPSFDYKLHFDPASLEYLDMPRQQWLPLAEFQPHTLPIVILHRQLADLGLKLGQEGLVTCLVHNIYFAFSENSRYDSPVMLLICPSQDQPGQSVVTYDHHTKEFHLFGCSDRDLPSEIRAHEGKMICMKHFQLRKPDHSFPMLQAAAVAIAAFLKTSS